jgi:hypothetical protein
MNTSWDLTLDVTSSVIGSIGREEVRLVELPHELFAGPAESYHLIRNPPHEMLPQRLKCQFLQVSSHIGGGISFTSLPGSQEDARKGETCASIQGNRQVV